MINKLMKRNKNEKGFTLVEVIVVLVILAILAAILVPSMIGWINKANQKTAIVSGRTELIAAQTIVSENYKTYTGDAAATELTTAHITEAEGLADVTGAEITGSTIANGKVTGIVVTYEGYTATYASGDWTVAGE